MKPRSKCCGVEERQKEDEEEFMLQIVRRFVLEEWIDYSMTSVHDRGSLGQWKEQIFAEWRNQVLGREDTEEDRSLR